jgi:hypothetical protein
VGVAGVGLPVVTPGQWRIDPEPSILSRSSTTSIVADSLWGSTPMMTFSVALLSLL